jgi:hypothetical protein
MQRLMGGCRRRFYKALIYQPIFWLLAVSVPKGCFPLLKDSLAACFFHLRFAQKRA